MGINNPTDIKNTILFDPSINFFDFEWYSKGVQIIVVFLEIIQFILKLLHNESKIVLFFNMPYIIKMSTWNVMFVFHNQHYSGLEEAVYRNIQACKELAQTTRTAYGPNGETLFCLMWCLGPFLCWTTGFWLDSACSFNSLQVWTKWSSTTWRNSLSQMTLPLFWESWR